MKRYLIRDTTRREREALVMDALTSCPEGGCEKCSGCGTFCAGETFEMYRPYIDGEREVSEISADFVARCIEG